MIAADEGIKPQTREHFDICKLLAIHHGITVLTKSDAVEMPKRSMWSASKWKTMRVDLFSTRLSIPQKSPIVAVSSLTGAGLDELKSALVSAASEVAVKNSAALAFLGFLSIAFSP